MKLVTVSGPPSSGKTSVILKMIEELKSEHLKIGVIKFDCLATTDDERYAKHKIPVKVGVSGNLCPDHFYVSNVADGAMWAEENGFDLLVTESAGLCNRCAPHIKEILAICVIDNLSGIHTPRKIGPMLKYADIVVVTKGDIVSQAEREVFSHHIRKVNARAKIIFVNGITGQGAFLLSRYLLKAAEWQALKELRLRFTMPAALCSYCMGQTRIGIDYQMGNVRKMAFGEDSHDGR